MSNQTQTDVIAYASVCVRIIIKNKTTYLLRGPWTMVQLRIQLFFPPLAALVSVACLHVVCHSDPFSPMLHNSISETRIFRRQPRACA